MTTTDYFNWKRTDDGVVVLTMDAPNKSANTMDEAFQEAIGTVVNRLETECENITGVVITSAKKTFFAGGDLELMMNSNRGDAQSVYDMLTTVKRPLRRLEQLGVPVVAAINGAALGGGYEIALAAHHRIVIDRPHAKVGLPETTLGLLPGAGGVTRTVRMFGLKRALEQVLLQGQQYGPAEAKELGLVDDIAADESELLSKALTWIAANPEARQPWDRPDFKIPGGTPASPSIAAVLPVLPAVLRKQLRGSPAPAQRNVLAAAVEGAQVDIESALDIETRYCTELICGQISTNIIKASFFDMQSIKKGVGRPDGYPEHKASKVSVIGAGMMGAAIAYVCASSGLEVVLKDVSQEGADRGKGYARKILDRKVASGQLSERARDEVLARITATDDMSATAGSDLVIEAVFENPTLKKQVFADLEEHVASDAVLGSNTSTLPITDLAGGVKRPEDFIGLHFFSPVDRMPLLEIVVGEKTSDATLAKAIDISQQIGKVPIVVNDSPGFFTTRVIVEYVLEAAAMVGEGISPAAIERAAVGAGYPVGPLALVDELTLALLRDIYNQAAEARGQDPSDRHPGMAVIERMIALGRPGRSQGSGFYDYAEGRKAGLSNTLAEEFDGQAAIDLTEVQDRLLFTESIDSVRCLDEGVLRSATDANVGSILGIGYPRWTGGVLQHINQYAGGPAGFVERAQELAKSHGHRFEPPASLLAKAAAGETYN